jgi:hypothetical protein
MGDTKQKEGEDVVGKVSEDRRDFIRKVIAAPYVLPVVTSFTLTALAAQPAMAGVINQTRS